MQNAGGALWIACNACCDVPVDFTACSADCCTGQLPAVECGHLKPRSRLLREYLRYGTTMESDAAILLGLELPRSYGCVCCATMAVDAGTAVLLEEDG